MVSETDIQRRVQQLNAATTEHLPQCKLLLSSRRIWWALEWIAWATRISRWGEPK